MQPVFLFTNSWPLSVFEKASVVCMYVSKYLSRYVYILAFSMLKCTVHRGGICTGVTRPREILVFKSTTQFL